MACQGCVWDSGLSVKDLRNSFVTATNIWDIIRLSEDIAIAALKSDAHYREVARMMNESRKMYEEEIRCVARI